MHLFTNLKQIRLAMKEDGLTLPSLLEHYFSIIERNEHLNAFVEVFFDSARQQATQVQNKIDSGNAGKLAGMIVSLKDNICYLNHSVSAASAMLQNFTSPYSATVVERLLQEDAVIIGRVNCDEFAMGGSNETSFYGPVKNAIDTEHVPGGSSGGSAVSVQAGMCLASIGTDTGGSVRQPAAFTGLVGFKPTYGRISRYGVIAYASSFDQVGTFTHEVDDAALLIEVLAGQDSLDATTLEQSLPPINLGQEQSQPIRIAVFKEMLESPALDVTIKSAIEVQIECLKSQGHTIDYISFDLLDYLVPSYYVLTTAEASSNLSRYDGVRFGHRSENANTLEDLYKNTRAEGFGEEVKRRILLGTFVLSAGYYDAYFQKAQKVRRLISDKLQEIFSIYDFILSPVTPTPPFKIGKHTRDPLEMYMEDIFTVMANLAGIPAISLPLGVNVDNLPMAYQLMANKFEDSKLIEFAHQLSRKN